jgi:hypothetical protein
METSRIVDDNPKVIFLLCLIYAIHMLEEFTLGFVEWADLYFGKFNWTQNLIGNSIYLVLLLTACYLYYKTRQKIIGWEWPVPFGFWPIRSSIFLPQS